MTVTGDSDWQGRVEVKCVVWKEEERKTGRKERMTTTSFVSVL